MRSLPLASSLCFFLLTACEVPTTTTPEPDQPSTESRAAARENLVKSIALAMDSTPYPRTAPTDTFELDLRGVRIPEGLELRVCHDPGFNDGCPSQARIDPTIPLRMERQDLVRIGLYDDGALYWVFLRTSYSEITSPVLDLGPLERDFWDNDTLTIRSPRPGLELRYTLDGSYPTPRSPRYEGPTILAGPSKVRVLAIDAGGRRSLSASLEQREIGHWNPDIAYDTLRDARDGQVYPVARFGDKIWMAKDLNWMPDTGAVKRSAGGTSYIFSVLVEKKIGLCPEGWSFPNPADWNDLRKWAQSHPGVDSSNYGNAMLRSGANANAVDLFGFRAAPGSVFWTGFLTESLQTPMQFKWDGSTYLGPERMDTPVSVRCIRNP